MAQMRTLSSAAFALAALTVAALAIGVALVQQLGTDAGGGSAALAARPLLIAAEAVKLASAVYLALAVRAAGGGLAKLAGWSSALLLAASGATALAALWSANTSLGAAANPLALASLVATGLWALRLAFGGERRLPAWLTIVAATFASAAIGAAFVPPVGLLAGLLGLFWWTGLGIAARRLANPGPTP